MAKDKSPKTKQVGAITSHERLALDAIEALRGAENLRERLIAALQFGNPAVSDLAYATKVRIKDDLKIVDKVINRRAGGGDRKAMRFPDKDD